MEFLHNSDGEFVSIDGNFLGGIPGDNVYIISTITFYDDYMLVQSFSDVPWIGIIAGAAPHAQRLEHAAFQTTHKPHGMHASTENLCW